MKDIKESVVQHMDIAVKKLFFVFGIFIVLCFLASAGSINVDTLDNSVIHQQTAGAADPALTVDESIDLYDCVNNNQGVDIFSDSECGPLAASAVAQINENNGEVVMAGPPIFCEEPENCPLNYECDLERGRCVFIGDDGSNEDDGDDGDDDYDTPDDIVRCYNDSQCDADFEYCYISGSGAGVTGNVITGRAQDVNDFETNLAIDMRVKVIATSAFVYELSEVSDNYYIGEQYKDSEGIIFNGPEVYGGSLGLMWDVDFDAGDSGWVKQSALGLSSSDDSGSGQEDTSNPPAQEVAKVVVPASGVVWEKGKAYTVNWETPASWQVTLARISLVKASDNSNVVSVAVLKPENDIQGGGFHRWTIPTNVADGLYKIRASISRQGSSTQTDIYSSSFKIQSVTETPPGVCISKDTSCVEKGESLGAVVPGNNRVCCEGLEPRIPQGQVGTRGICVDVDNTTCTNTPECAILGQGYVCDFTIPIPYIQENNPNINSNVVAGSTLGICVPCTSQSNQITCPANSCGVKLNNCEVAVNCTAVRGQCASGKECGENFVCQEVLDEHGCSASAGQIWCQAKNKCLIPSQESCTTTVVDNKTCSDSDGFDPFSFGFVSGKLASGANYRYNDSCVNSKVKEWECSLKVSVSSEYSCSDSCSNGKCVSITNPTCVANQSNASLCGNWQCGLKLNNCNVSVNCGLCSPTSDFSCNDQHQCVPSGANLSPTINTFTGPDTLDLPVGVSYVNGTWTVKATDPEGKPLRIKFVWGDGTSGEYFNIPSGSTYTRSHSYLYMTPVKNNNRVIVIIVTDSEGLTATLPKNLTIICNACTGGSGSGELVVTSPITKEYHVGDLMEINWTAPSTVSAVTIYGMRKLSTGAWDSNLIASNVPSSSGGQYNFLLGTPGTNIQVIGYDSASKKHLSGMSEAFTVSSASSSDLVVGGKVKSFHPEAVWINVFSDVVGSQSLNSKMPLWISGIIKTGSPKYFESDLYRSAGWYWNVNFTSGTDGWVSEKYLISEAKSVDIVGYFAKGGKVQVVSVSSPRLTPNGANSYYDFASSPNYIGNQPQGQTGTAYYKNIGVIVDDAQEAGGKTWLKVDFNVGADGWMDKSALVTTEDDATVVPFAFSSDTLINPINVYVGDANIWTLKGNVPIESASGCTGSQGVLYEVDFGDGTPKATYTDDCLGGIMGYAPESIMKHTYAKNGTFTIQGKATSTVTGYNGTAMKNLKVIVSYKPFSISVFTYNTISNKATISINGGSVGNMTYKIDWKDGFIVTLSGADAGKLISHHTYASAGTYSPKLTVTDSAGQKAEKILNVQITDSFPVAQPSSVSTNFSVGDKVKGIVTMNVLKTPFSSGQPLLGDGNGKTGYIIDRPIWDGTLWWYRWTAPIPNDNAGNGGWSRESQLQKI